MFKQFMTARLSDGYYAVADKAKKKFVLSFVASDWDMEASTDHNDIFKDIRDSYGFKDNVTFDNMLGHLESELEYEYLNEEGSIIAICFDR